MRERGLKAAYKLESRRTAKRRIEKEKAKLSDYKTAKYLAKKNLTLGERTVARAMSTLSIISLSATSAAIGKEIFNRTGSLNSVLAINVGSLFAQGYVGGKVYTNTVNSMLKKKGLSTKIK